MDSPEKYCMKWNSYLKHIGSFFSILYESEILTDVTLWVENQKFNCHQIILSACSPYFQELLSNAVSKHPIIILAGIHPDDIKTIIHFIYHGELDNISYDRFISVLKTAEMLKICGMTEIIEHMPPQKCLDNLEEIIMMNEEANASESVQGDNFTNISEEDEDNHPKTKKYQRKYSDGSIIWALNDIEKGMSLVEAAKLYKIPRSTLYAKVKQHSGLTVASRKEHTNQDCQAAVQAVAGGLSLKRAAEQYGIPKTVLWRRVQKRMDICTNLKSRRKKSERNNKFQDSDKINLVKSGTKLTAPIRACGSSVHINKIRTADVENDGLNNSNKQYRLAQALNACKEGKMSQALASRTFQVPKTLIWRRLQKAWSVNQNNEGTSFETMENSPLSEETNNADDLKYIPVLSNNEDKNNNADIEEHFTEAPVIFLASTNETLPKQEISDDELIESLNVRIENVVEVISDKEDANWQ